VFDQRNCADFCELRIFTVIVLKPNSKNWFFDRQAVIEAVGRAEARVLSQGGAYVQRTAKKLIRSRKRISRPGEPPSTHDTPGQKSLLRSRLYFAWDSDKRVCVVGPQALHMVYFDRHRQPLKGAVPGVLEHGGEITVLEELIGGTWFRRDLRRRIRGRTYPQRYRTVHIAARPYMRVALERETNKITEAWKNAVK